MLSCLHGSMEWDESGDHEFGQPTGKFTKEERCIKRLPIAAHVSISQFHRC